MREQMTLKSRTSSLGNNIEAVVNFVGPFHVRLFLPCLSFFLSKLFFVFRSSGTLFGFTVYLVCGSETETMW